MVKEVEVEGMENRMDRGLAFLDTLSVINEDGTMVLRSRQEYTEKKRTRTNISISRVITLWNIREVW